MDFKIRTKPPRLVSPDWFMDPFGCPPSSQTENRPWKCVGYPSEISQRRRRCTTRQKPYRTDTVNASRSALVLGKWPSDCICCRRRRRCPVTEFTGAFTCSPGMYSIKYLSWSMLFLPHAAGRRIIWFAHAMELDNGKTRVAAVSWYNNNFPVFSFALSLVRLLRVQQQCYFYSLRSLGI